MARMGDKEWVEFHFPNIGSWRRTSPRDASYNCIAYAAGCTGERWDVHVFYYWPGGAERSMEVRALQSCFKAIGFSFCDDGSRERGFDKVALYGSGGRWTHAARQTARGTWSSKLGDGVDIEHSSVECLYDSAYGEVVCYMRRPKGVGSGDDRV